MAVMQRSLLDPHIIEEAVAMDEPRIGAWICDCKGQISDKIDTRRLEEETKKLPNVVFVKRVGLLCTKEEIARLTAELIDTDADRLLFIGCSARSSLRFPEQQIVNTLKHANIDEALFETANVREQCAWIHEPGEAATSKALDVIKMAHARLMLDVPRGPAVKIVEKSLVVGGGPAGLAVAKDLAGVGKEVTIVERGTYLGGRLCQIPFLFQTENWPGRCVSICVGPVQASGAVLNPLIDAYTQSSVERVGKVDGNFRARIKVGAPYVDPQICISCGKCAEVCPEDATSDFNEGLFVRKAIDKDFPRAVPDVYNILDAFCTKCGKCVDVCPTDAIDLEARPEIREDTFGAVFLATGFDSYDLKQNEEFNYGSPNVVTGIEFERLLDRGVQCPSNGKVPEHIVFVLCAGSRATREKEGKGVPYCSKTCCGITMKQAERVALTMEETEVTIIYYYDIRTYERTFEELYDNVRRMGIEFVKGNIDSVEENEDQGLTLSLAQLDDQASSSGGEYVFEDGALKLKADMVVLASAQIPKKGADTLAKQLKLATDPAGFPMENQPRLFRPTESFVDRAYVVGASTGPKVVQQAVEQGKAAAMSALPYLMKGEKELPKFVSSIDPEICINCRICETVCPHGAITITEEGVITDPAFCQGCGFCAAACPTHAAKLINFTDKQILDQVDVAFGGLKEGEPKIMALLCYWCSYCGADLAGANGLRAPVNYRSIRIRCSSSVNTALIVEMFRRGVDGILIGGCPTAACHHVNGNYLTDKRMALLGNLMDQLGLDGGRLRFDYIGVPHSQKFVDTITEMDKQLRELGPNPAGKFGKKSA
jgi:heterodisulfide reductase subunit A